MGQKASCMCIAGGGAPHQILFLGPEGTGKTTLLYSLKIPNWKTMPKDLENLAQSSSRNWDPSYHYEELSGGPLVKYGIWDVPGSETMVPMWPAFYRYIPVTALLFVVDGSPEGRENDALIQRSKRQMQFLLNEDELRNSAFVLIINTKEGQRDKAHAGQKTKTDTITLANTIGELLGVNDIKTNSAQAPRFLQYILNATEMTTTHKDWMYIMEEIYKIYLCVGPGRFT
eukprot:TRINITY_DN122485_c0_g1_i1.p1 TRINITY_DN122485_c0_g1~~TRINITY_DN122485_c0_g1_i1.p1  ORF type:complete len:229 (-),score=31.96 TRINITY_DN122485_c0_g1_i1:184-870(-)